MFTEPFSLRSIFRRWAKLPILLIFYFPPLESATYNHSLPALPLDLHHIPLLHTGCDSHIRHTLPVSFCPHCWQLAELGYGPTLAGSASLKHIQKYKKMQRKFKLLLIKTIMNKVIPGYNFNFCLGKPVVKVQMIIFVIQANEKGCVA